MTRNHFILSSKAARAGYLAGGLLLCGARRWMSLKTWVCVKTTGGEVPLSRRACFYVFTLLELLVLVALVSVSFWFLSVAIMAGVLLIMGWIGSLAEISEGEVDPGPDYLGADLYLGDYDDNGHYIGGCKSSP
ncbi:hypothetical protein [Pseudomonas syringae]|uniref:hypothetical protein n=1 Tax=Pseudomonas syringae TaxID=317 RepID=UPI000A5A89D2|nr:hypothetical protein [Pseudomonas syringae]